MNAVMDDCAGRRVLIYDEAGFSKVCSALLEMSGCSTDIMGESAGAQFGSDIGVFVTSYPYGAIMLDEVRKRRIPAVVLFDSLDDRLVTFLHEYDNLYYMLKPLNYDKFKDLVRRLLKGGKISRQEFSTI